ncbi:MAG: ATP-binding protein [Desulfobacterales bacterium]|nr:ATP-binding protein [Desulfobacterales bacterium]
MSDLGRDDRGIREINRLLVRSEDQAALIRGTCRILTDKRGYTNTWIGLLDDQGKVSELVDADNRVEPLGTSMIQENLIQGILDILFLSGTHKDGHPIQGCHFCLPPSPGRRGAGLAVRLAFKGHVYGFISVALKGQLSQSGPEREFLQEIADIMGAALHRFNLEHRSVGDDPLEALMALSLNQIIIIQDDQVVYKNSGLRRVHSLMADTFDPPDFNNVFEDDREGIVRAYQGLTQGWIPRLETSFRYYPKGFEPEESRLRWALISAGPIQYKGRDALAANVMDITDSKEIQNFLRIQDKMASLGRVTAGIAHEIRNPLSGIYIYLKSLKNIYNEMGDVTRVVSIIDKMEMASEKIESIIKRVMDFSRPGQPQFIKANLNAYINEVTQLTAVTLRKRGIKFLKDLDPTVPECRVEPQLIEQVILNLVTNAAEALKDHDGEKCIFLTTARGEDYMEICITDTGPGIPDSKRSRIFDPFYTTKANSSGIGLSISHRIIVDHGGSLELDSAPGKGAKFTVRIPFERPADL